MTVPKQALENCTILVEREDPDRYLSSLFAPEDLRQSLHALYAFDNEIRLVPDRVTEPLLGEIRLQWWRDAVADIYEKREPRPHDTVIAVAYVIMRYDLPRAEFDALIDARAFDLYDEPMSDLKSFQDYATGTEVSCLSLATKILAPGGEMPEGTLQDLGEAWALMNDLRRTSAGAAHHARVAPVELATEDFATHIGEKLISARARLSNISGDVLPGLLHMCLIESYLRKARLEPAQVNLSGLYKRYKLLKHSLLGRI